MYIVAMSLYFGWLDGFFTVWV